MGHRHFFRHLGKEEIFCIIIASVGVGMALAIIVPFWWWIVVVAVCLVGFAINQYFC